MFLEEAAVLKRRLSILSDLIFDSRVDRGIPGLAAAPQRTDSKGSCDHFFFLRGDFFGGINRIATCSVKALTSSSSQCALIDARGPLAAPKYQPVQRVA